MIIALVSLWVTTNVVAHESDQMQGITQKKMKNTIPGQKKRFKKAGKYAQHITEASVDGYNEDGVTGGGSVNFNRQYKNELKKINEEIEKYMCPKVKISSFGGVRG